MANIEHTRASLILRLADPHDAAAWEDFVAIYEPFLLGLIRQWGLQEHDARDVLQEVLLSVAQAVGRFERREFPGAFRGWLSKIAKSKLANHLSGCRKGTRGDGGTDAWQWLAQVPEPDRGDSIWDLELRRRLMVWASEHVQRQVRPTTWIAFHDTTVLGKSVAETARALAIPEGMVYVARSRVMSKLRKMVESWCDEESGDWMSGQEPEETP